MKVIFIGVGLVHYFNPILNRLNDLDGVEIINLVPSNSRGHLQPGVFTTQEGVRFTVVSLEEIRITPLYKSYSGLNKLIKSVNPDIIVYTDYYANIFLFDLPVILTVRRRGIKLIMKSIPFRLKKYSEALTDPDNLPDLNNYLPQGLRGKIALPGFRKLLRRIKVYLHKRAFSIPDAYVNYILESRQIYSSYGVSEDRIFITYNSPDTDFLLSVRAKIENDPPLLPPSCYRIIHVGRLVEWKNVDLLIRALHSLKPAYPTAELVIVGDGPMRKNLQALADHLGLSESVLFTGAIYNPAVLGRYFLSSSVYVLAGMGGLSINDAMCFGKPVVCSVCDGTEKMLVRDWCNGLLFRNGDLPDLTYKIRYLFRHPERCRAMGARSTQIIRDEINVHTVMKGYIDAFRFVMRQGLKSGLPIGLIGSRWKSSGCSPPREPASAQSEGFLP